MTHTGVWRWMRSSRHSSTTTHVQRSLGSSWLHPASRRRLRRDFQYGRQAHHHPYRPHLGSLQKLAIHQLDIKNAFLYNSLSKTVYCTQPSNFIDSAHPDYVSLSILGLGMPVSSPMSSFVALSILILADGGSSPRTSVFVPSTISCTMVRTSPSVASLNGPTSFSRFPLQQASHCSSIRYSLPSVHGGGFHRHPCPP
jgi:hypothetical protein